MEKTEQEIPDPLENFYYLISIVHNLIARAGLNKGIISDDIIEEICKVFSFQKEQEGFTTDEIMKAVCRAFKLEKEWMMRKSRKKVHTLPRQIFLYLCRKLIPDITLETLGKIVNRSHSAILYSTEIIEAKIERDPRLKRQVNFIKENLKEKLEEK